jgi:hypothetical protein
MRGAVKWHTEMFDPKFTMQKFFEEALDAHLRRYKMWTGGHRKDSSSRKKAKTG